MHFVNAEKEINCREKKFRHHLEEITKIIEDFNGIDLDKSSFNYSRFATHIQYLLQRNDLDKRISKDNSSLLESLIKSSPKAYDCAIAIKDSLYKKDNRILGDEEILYLVLHINRLCTREGCYQ